MEENKSKNIILKIFVWCFLAALGGLLGSWLYGRWLGPLILRDLTNQKLSDLNNSLSQVIIKDAKQVVVEQDTRAAEVINAAEKIIVGIFKKKTDNNYELLSSVATGLLITSDGWLVSNWGNKDEQYAVNDFVVITKEKKIYDINKVVYDEFSGLTFVNIKNANSLPVANFSASLELKRGQTVFLLDWLKTFSLATLTENRRRDSVLSSDQPIKELSLSINEPNGLVAIDLSGRVVAWITRDDRVVSVDYITNAIGYFLNNKQPVKTVFGVNYLNQDYYLKDKQPAGALIVKNKKGSAVVLKSPAEAAGLKEGDIIYSIDDQELAYGLDLADLIATYQPGQKISVKYWRGSEKKEAIVVLGGM